MKKSILIIVMILVISSLACSVNINVPRVETGPVQTIDFNQEAPENNEQGNLYVSMGGGRLEINGNSDKWVTGNVEYNIPMWKPEVNQRNDTLELTQETKDNFGLPNNKVINDWVIQIGDVPTDLNIKAGAYQGALDFSGIPLTNLEIADGASQADITFDQLNPVVMQNFSYKTGASQISMFGLSNANFEEMRFDGGAGSYTLDFSGDLQRDTDINVNFGLGDVKIIIPKGVPANVIVDGGLNNVELTGTWNIDGKDYNVNGTGPKLSFHVKMGLGNLQLISR
jgi:hypothetical protein